MVIHITVTNETKYVKEPITPLKKCIGFFVLTTDYLLFLFDRKVFITFVITE